jgi:putative ABC transport system permease protein
MMDDLEEVSDADKYKLAAACEEMERYPFKVLMGPSRLAALNKKVGERIKVTSLNYKGIDLEFEIFGQLPGGRYEQSAVMNYHYLDEALRSYNQGKSKDQQHPMTERTLALMWVRVPDTPTFERVAEQVTTSPEYKSPAVKCETASSGIASFLDAYRTLLWGMRWLLTPAILGTLALVIANAISISVRERRTEIAVLKLVNDLIHGIALPIAFFGKFFVTDAAIWWGLAVGAGTALVGSLVPAWSARSVKVAEVFSKVA